MLIYESNDGNIPTGTHSNYEAVASRDEIYLVETKEELRVIVESDDSPPPQSESPNQQEHLAEELITGDADDPPLSEESVEEMLKND